jgi:hypothetical protein
MCAAVVMNTIEWDRFTSSQTLIHTQAMMLVMVCFVSFFIQGGYVIWRAVEAPCVCTDAEAYFVIIVSIGASVLRFTEPLVRDTNMQKIPYKRAIQGTPNYAFNIAATIASAAFAVSALLLQAFATFGRLGRGISILVPAPYAVVLPFVVVVRSIARIQGTYVWNNWAHCTTVALHTFCTFWAVVLYSTEYIDTAQAILCFLSNVCLMIA